MNKSLLGRQPTSVRRGSLCVVPFHLTLTSTLTLTLVFGGVWIQAQTPLVLREHSALGRRQCAGCGQLQIRAAAKELLKA